MQKLQKPASARWLALALPGLTLALAAKLPAWAFMWLLALALGFAFKLVVWWPHARDAGPLQSTAYLAGWVGMDPGPFLKKPSVRPLPVEWRAPLLQMLLGAALFWGLARRVPAGLPAAWVGLVGFALLAHFGLFGLLAAAWRRSGIDVHPIMLAPIRAVSLGEFWGRRWNRAFRYLAHRWLFRPLLPRLGALGASAACYLASGLVHDLVISVPARGGYGLPTAYFLIQTAGSIIERTGVGRRLGLGRGVRGWAFTAAVVAAPAYWLFHPPFLEKVFFPFMQVLGALE